MRTTVDDAMPTEQNNNLFVEKKKHSGADPDLQPASLTNGGIAVRVERHVSRRTGPEAAGARVRPGPRCACPSMRNKCAAHTDPVTRPGHQTQYRSAAAVRSERTGAHRTVPAPCRDTMAHRHVALGFAPVPDHCYRA